MLKDCLTSLLLLIVAVTYLWMSRQINRSALADDFGAAGLPSIYAYLLGALALAMLAKTGIATMATRQRTASAANEQRRDRIDLGRAAGMLAIGVAYLVLVPYLGYTLALIVIIALAAAYQGEELGIRLAAISTGGALFFYVLFVQLLGVAMPAGFWSGLAP